MRTGEGGGARLGRDGVRGGTGFLSLSLCPLQPFPLPSPPTHPHPTPLHSRRHRLPAPGRRRPQARRRPGRQGKRGGRRLCGRPGRPLPHPLPPVHAGPGPGGGPGGGGGRPPARLSGGPIWGAHVRVAGWGAGGRVKGECVCACVVGVCQESAAPHLRNGGGALPPPPPPPPPPNPPPPPPPPPPRPGRLPSRHPTRPAAPPYYTRPAPWPGTHAHAMAGDQAPDQADLAALLRRVSTGEKGEPSGGARGGGEPPGALPRSHGRARPPRPVIATWAVRPPAGRAPNTPARVSRARKGAQGGGAGPAAASVLCRRKDDEKKKKLLAFLAC